MNAIIAVAVTASEVAAHRPRKKVLCIGEAAARPSGSLFASALGVLNEVGVGPAVDPPAVLG